LQQHDIEVLVVGSSIDYKMFIHQVIKAYDILMDAIEDVNGVFSLEVR